jgi:hypothetical protein
MLSSPAELVEFIRTHSPPNAWTTYFNESLRTVGDGMCPICWVAYVAGHNPERSVLDAVTMGQRLGLTDKHVHEIMSAADHNDLNDQLRIQLMDACGITTGGR